MTISRYDIRGESTIPEALLKRTESDLSIFLQRVEPIIAEVRENGDVALEKFARAYDGLTAENFSVRATDAEFEAARDLVSEDVKSAIRFALDNVRRFHEKQLPEPMWMMEIQPGAYAGEASVPLDSIACYVPRGKASFPSVAINTVTPAVVAGVRQIVILTPCGPDGTVDPATLYVADLLGVRDIFKCGGAQAVAAVAYGTPSVPRCLKIVGPGSPYLIAAKKLLANRIDPGSPAGPSESIVIADENADPVLAALDLLVESEHGPDSSAYLVTHSQAVADAVAAEIPKQWAAMSEKRVEFSKAVLCGPHGGIILTRDLDQSIEFVNDYAPEHLEVLVDDPWSIAGRFRNASEILLGPETPIPLANFVLGPNHVLPTSGTAKTASPLSVHDYMKRISIGHVTSRGYDGLAHHAEKLARYEGFDAHARSVSDERQALRRK